ncbi:DUF3039 domain-containing protein [Leucobacter chinensis]|uniref:DUF3039 domain-containing protein n=1 Tax=Leucobacter chinensis TaxID=2851010 RepID=UPI001C24661F
MTYTNHFVPKTEISRSLIEGVRVYALCGETVLCTSQGPQALAAGSTGRKNTPICVACQLLFMTLSSETSTEKGEGNAHHQPHCLTTP